MESLPEIVFSKLFEFLSPKDMCQLSQCSLSCYISANSNQFWFRNCMEMGFIKFGIQGKELHQLPSIMKTATNISGTDPQFSYDVFNHESLELWRLPSVSKWHLIYLMSRHLIENWKTGRYLVSSYLRGHNEGKICALDCDGKYIVSGSDDGRLCVWSLHDLALELQTDLYTGIACLKIFPNESQCVVGLDTGELMLYDVKSLAYIDSYPNHTDEVIYIELMEDKLISIGNDKAIQIWNFTSKTSIRLEGHTEDITSYSIATNNVLATGSWDQSVIIWDLKLGKRLLRIKENSEGVSCIKFAAYDHLVVGSLDGTLSIWSLKGTVHCLHRLHAHTEVYCLDCLDDRIVTGGSDSRVKLWNFQGDCLFTLEGHFGIVRFVQLTDFFLLTAGDVRKIMIWDVDQGQLCNELHRNPSQVGKLWRSDTHLIVANSAQPGTISVMSFW